MTKPGGPGGEVRASDIGGISSQCLVMELLNKAGDQTMGEVSVYVEKNQFQPIRHGEVMKP